MLSISQRGYQPHSCGDHRSNCTRHPRQVRTSRASSRRYCARRRYLQSERRGNRRTAIHRGRNHAGSSCPRRAARPCRPGRCCAPWPCSPARPIGRWTRRVAPPSSPGLRAPGGVGRPAGPGAVVGVTPRAGAVRTCAEVLVMVGEKMEM